MTDLTREQMIDEAVRRQIGTIDRLDGLCDVEIFEALWNVESYQPFRNEGVSAIRTEFRRIEALA